MPPFITVYRSKLLQALQMAVLDLEEGHAPDPFRYADYNLANPSLLDRIEVNLKRGVFRPSLPLELSFPKSEFAIRPGKRIELEDLVLVYYCLLLITGDLEDKLKSGVTAYRVRQTRPPRVVQAATLILPRYLRRRLRIVDPWYNAWPGFIRALRRDYTRYGRRLIGTSDITSFYEDVDLGLLRAELRTRVRKCNLPLVNILVEMYQAWSARDVHLVRQNRGLPQGTTSSGVIANYYLMPFDEVLDRYARSKGLRWYRYNDDMRLIGANREDIRIGLRAIGNHLARLNLIQQGSKTKILAGAEARAELFDQRPRKIQEVVEIVSGSQRITTRSKVSVLRRLDAILETIRDVGQKRDSTALAMLYRAYGELSSDRLLPRWKQDYLREPTRARGILSYVANFLDRPGQCKAVVAMLSRQRGKATDWETAQFLRTCRRMRHLPPEIPSRLNSLAQAKGSNWYVRQQAILTISWLRLISETRQLCALISTEWDDEVRRAIVAIAFLLGTPREDELLKRASRDQSAKVSRMANYLLELRDNSELAKATLKQFRQPDEVFFCDNFWKLYQIRWNDEPNTANMFQRILERSQSRLRGRFVREHIQGLSDSD